MKMLIKISLKVFLAVVLLAGCQNDDKVYVPKPRMYPKVEFPDRNIVSFDQSECELSFTYPDYFQYQKDEFKFEGKPTNDCWFDLQSKELNLSLHCSYYPINEGKSLDELINDSFKITGKHNSKASARKESLIQDKNLGGIMFEVDGPVASPIQFFLTDSVDHFFRASFYFDAKVNQDSTQIIYDFVKEDIDLILKSFEFK